MPTVNPGGLGIQPAFSVSCLESDMQQMSEARVRPMPAWRSPWIIAWFALVGVFLAVNGVMIYLAVTTNPGLVVEDYYDRGQHYEQHLASQMARDPGWVLRAEIPRDIKAGETRGIQFFAADKDGQPLVLDQVTFYAYRPSDKGRDFSVPMEGDGPGHYVAEVRFSDIGVWDGVFSVRIGSEEHSLGKRLLIGRP
jgi:nitrogen fixation protein FixH